MIKIITDTASDITTTQAREMDISLVNICINFGDVAYDQLADESFQSFYELLENSKEHPTTSQPPPDAYLTLFEEAKNNKDDVVVVALSAEMSGTFQSAEIAKNICGYDNVYIVNSQQAIIGQRLLVEMAVKMRKEGKAATEIVDVLEEAKTRVRTYGALDTLKHLRMSGRIPKTTELLGTMMAIKPMICLENGSVVMAGKARGHAGLVTSMMRNFEKNMEVDTSAPVYFGYTKDVKHCKHFSKLAATKFNLKDTRVYPVGPIVGTHVGPYAFAFAFLEKA